MFPLPEARTATMRLETVLERLSQHPAVDGLVTIGSTARQTLSPASDYDLLVIVADQPLPFRVGITSIDHRLTDLLFGTSTHIATILQATTAIDGTAWEGRIARWLLEGQIAFDRCGDLHAVQHKVRTGNWIRELDLIDSYGAWIGINYNLLQTKRMLQSDDPIYRGAAEWRITLYGIPSILYSYFQIRKLYWQGDKEALRYLLANDPDYADLFQQLLRESDPERKFERYEQLAIRTLAPIGALWHPETTVLWDDGLPATWQKGIQKQELCDARPDSFCDTSDHHA
jgi:predicted nucleotidyltransferase